EDSLAVRMVTFPFAVIERTAIHEQPRLPIPLEGPRPENFREPAFAVPAPHLELPQTIRGRDVTLREKQVVDRLRVDVRNAPLVADDVDRRTKTRRDRLAVQLRQRLAGERFQIAIAGRPSPLRGFLTRGRSKERGGHQSDSEEANASRKPYELNGHK